MVDEKTERFYRYWSTDKDLISFSVAVKESDLLIRCKENLARKALKSILKYRSIIEEYINRNPIFKTSLEPIPCPEDVPLIVKEMIKATQCVGVGPMAAVAGAIAEFVGLDLLKYTPEVIVENGGDIFMKTEKIRRIGIYAGKSIFTKKIALEISPEKTPIGICTSSGTFGHSLSLGRADAAVVISQSAILADAAATAIGNLIQDEYDIPKGIEFAQKIKGIIGVLIIKNEKMGIWGDIKLCRM